VRRFADVAAVRQLPGQPAGDVAEQQLAALGAAGERRVALEQPRQLGCRERGVERKPGDGGQRGRLRPACQRSAELGRSLVLPAHDRRHRSPRLRLPQHERLGLVGDADRRDRPARDRFAGELMWNAIVPLVPAFSQRFGFSKLEGGELLASTSVAILLVSIPAGMLSERYGERRLTLVAMAVMAAADLGQGLAGSFAALLGARALFGLGFGILWTAGVAWLSEASGDRHAQALSLAMTTAGFGAIAGPAFAGVLVQRFGLAAPFTVAAVATLAVMVALMLDSSGSGGAVEVAQPLVSIVRAAVSDHGVLVSVLLMSLGGLIGGVVNLLVPLQLRQNGMSTASIGLLFGVSAAAFIASSAVTARFGDRAARNEVAVVVSLMAAAVMVLPAVAASTAALVAFLLVRAPIMALMFTITFPIGVAGAKRAGISVAAVA